MKHRLLALATALLFALSASFASVPASQAVTGADFRAGRIIDDSIFYNKSAMTVSQIQQFLDSKVPNCDRNGTKPSEYGGGTRAQYGAAHGAPAPYTCVKDYYENTSTKENNLEGRPIPSDAKSAAQIIWDAAQEFSINPQVLIVLLQKEQALILDEWPFPVQYRSATGQGCPDTAPCDSQYYGFYNQVRGSARQFRLYANNPGNYNHLPGQNNSVRWSPDASCGSGTVFIENQATASLYNYTPYQPNQAALNNLYGTGDGCSAYGNRNFWRIFNDWFGTTILVSQKWDGTAITRVKKRNYGTAQQVFYSTATQIHLSSWWPGSNGIHKEVVLTVPPGEKIMDFDKINHPDGITQSLYVATQNGVYMTQWSGTGYSHASRIIDLVKGRQIIAEVVNGTTPTYRLYVLTQDGPYEYWWRDLDNISDKFRFWNINNAIDIVKSRDSQGKDEVYVATPWETYRMKWPVNGDIERKKLTSITDAVGIEKQTLENGTELLYTITKTGVHETWWRNNGPLSDNFKVADLPGDEVVDATKTITNGYHQLYVGTKNAAYEYWWKPGGQIHSGRLVGRNQLIDLDKTRDGNFQNLYTATPTTVYETWWGGGLIGTGAIVKFE